MNSPVLWDTLCWQVKLGKFAIKQHQGELKDQLARMCNVQDSVTELKINVGDAVTFLGDMLIFLGDMLIFWGGILIF